MYIGIHYHNNSESFSVPSLLKIEYESHPANSQHPRILINRELHIFQIAPLYKIVNNFVTIKGTVKIPTAEKQIICCIRHSEPDNFQRKNKPFESISYG